MGESADRLNEDAARGELKKAETLVSDIEAELQNG